MYTFPGQILTFISFTTMVQVRKVLYLNQVLRRLSYFCLLVLWISPDELFLRIIFLSIFSIYQDMLLALEELACIIQEHMRISKDDNDFANWLLYFEWVNRFQLYIHSPLKLSNNREDSQLVQNITLFSYSDLFD